MGFYKLICFGERKLKHVPVSPWSYKIEAAMNPIVGNVASIQAALVVEEPLELVIDVFEYGPNRVGAID